MSTPNAWLFGPHVALDRARQSLSQDEHQRILAPLQAGQPSAHRITQLRDAMLSGDPVNASEQRAAGHWALRLAGSRTPERHTLLPQRFAPNGEDLLPKMRRAHQHMSQLVEAVQSGAYHASSGERFSDVIHLGIGGSDSGPQLLISALRTSRADLIPRVHFLANLDYHGVQHLLMQCDPQRTLVVMVSKSFTTHETIHNAEHVLAWMRQAHVPHPERHLIAVTARPDRAQQWSIPEHQILWFDDSIGGRYSLWGPVSFAARLALGNACVDAFLEGGLAMDAYAISTPLARNLPAVLAATDAYNLRHRRIPTLMVSAYDSRLILLVPYLKQLWMESLGKHIDRDGQPLNGPACPILWGDVGTNAQHAFFQLLHQGAHGVAIELIASVQPEHAAQESHDALLANFIAQAQALATGFTDENAHKTCWGGHPVNVMLLDRLSPEALGALIGLWEYRVLALAALHHINPFDQWGVELGKSMAQSAFDILHGDAVPHNASISSTDPTTGPVLDDISRSLIQWLRDQR
ncbi:MAG: hypothetical protein ACO26Y_04025 [Burkholderiaceae bacterium]